MLIQSSILSLQFWRELSKSEKLVLLCLIIRANTKTKACHPGIRRIAKDASVCTDTVGHALVNLTAMKLILVRKRFKENIDGVTVYDTNEYDVSPVMNLIPSPTPRVGRKQGT